MTGHVMWSLAAHIIYHQVLYYLRIFSALRPKTIRQSKYESDDCDQLSLITPLILFHFLYQFRLQYQIERNQSTFGMDRIEWK